MSRRILTYSTEQKAQAAIKRLLKKYPVHPDCTVEAVASTHWQYPFKFLIRVTGKDNSQAYWSAKR
jgi:hypothetical protein